MKWLTNLLKIISGAEKTNQKWLKCLKCKGTKWEEGPGGGSFGNIKCSNCGAKYNNLGPFGLQEI